MFYILFYSPFRRERIKCACLLLPRPWFQQFGIIRCILLKYLSRHKLIYNHLWFSANNIIILYCYVHFSLIIINISSCQFIKFYSILYNAVNYYYIAVTNQHWWFSTFYLLQIILNILEHIEHITLSTSASNSIIQISTVCIYSLPPNLVYKLIFPPTVHGMPFPHILTITVVNLQCDR